MWPLMTPDKRGINQASWQLKDRARKTFLLRRLPALFALFMLRAWSVGAWKWHLHNKYCRFSDPWGTTEPTVFNCVKQPGPGSTDHGSSVKRVYGWRVLILSDVWHRCIKLVYMSNYCSVAMMYVTEVINKGFSAHGRYSSPIGSFSGLQGKN